MALTKIATNLLETDPLDRSNHTGTQPASSILADTQLSFVTDAEKSTCGAKGDMLLSGIQSILKHRPNATVLYNIRDWVQC